ncbi:MAG: HAD-IA family hydrolase [Prevotellaceae bacterium]|jgi:HAD superfamily hydrolase (TIGR01509 family)|nr:HAD-IA family hydrolase [Prevotellaceae bacterium]
MKAVLFDMDGVLFDSMPYHAEAWHQAMTAHGFTFSRAEAFLHEGRTGAGTINIVSLRERGKEASPEEIQQIYAEKSEAFNRFPEVKPMAGAWKVLQKVKAAGLIPMIVTGSGQSSLLERLDKYFPHTFVPERMVTAFDVKHGKPDPEPYLMALQKGGLTADEAVVVENAPLGIQSAVAAGIFTIAVNTGPLSDDVLLDAGADLLFHSMNELSERWNEIDR